MPEVAASPLAPSPSRKSATIVSTNDRMVLASECLCGTRELSIVSTFPTLLTLPKPDSLREFSLSQGVAAKPLFAAPHREWVTPGRCWTALDSRKLATTSSASRVSTRAPSLSSEL
eukprot:3787485-Prymnesium_polylepis.1